MQFVLNYMRVRKNEYWKRWKWVAFTYNLKEKVIFFAYNIRGMKYYI
jgi:hypothetical protein